MVRKGGPDSPPKPTPIRASEELGPGIEDPAGAIELSIPEETQEMRDWVVKMRGGIPAFITTEVRNQLERAGYSKEQVGGMNPIQAHFITLGGEPAMRSDTALEGIRVDEERDSHTPDISMPDNPSPGDLFEVKMPTLPDEKKFLEENPKLFLEKDGKLYIHRVLANEYSKSQFGKINNTNLNRIQKGQLNINDVKRGASSQPGSSEPANKSDTPPNSLDSAETTPWTPHEGKEGLKEVVKKFPNLNPVGEDGKSRTSLEEAIELNRNPEVEEKKDAYFTALKKFQKERGSLGIIAENFTGEKTTEELKALRQEWIQARARYAEAQLADTEARLTSPERGGSDELAAKRGTDEYRDKVMARYNRLVTNRSVVLGAEEEEQKAREEGLSSREKKILDTFNDLYKKQPPEARIIGTSALMMGGTAIALGSGIGVIALALGSTSAALRIRAERARAAGNAKGEKVASTSARLTSLGGIFGLLGERLVQRHHKNAGTLDKAQETLSSRATDSLGNAATLDRISKERKEALGAQSRIDRQARIARLSGAAAGGAAIAGVHGALSGEDTAPPPPSEPRTADVLENQDTSPSSPAQAPVAPEARPGQNAPSEPASPQAQAIPEGSSASEIEPPRPGVEGRLEAGDGANEMLYELRAGLIEQYGENLEGAPEYVKSFVNEHSMLERSREFGFMTDEGSVLVHKDATLSFNSDGELVLKNPGADEVILMNPDGSTNSEGISTVKAWNHWHTGVEGNSQDIESSQSGQESLANDRAGSGSTQSAPVRADPIPGAISDTSITSAVDEEPRLPETTSNRSSILGRSPEDRLMSNGSDLVNNTSTESATERYSGPVSDGVLGRSPEDRLLSTDADVTNPVSPETPMPPSSEVPPGFGTSGARGLSIEPAAFSIRDSSNEVFVHSGGSPEKNFQLAKEYAEAHPGSKVYFDNAQERWGGLRAPIARIGSISFAENGQPVLNPQESDAAGRPITSVEQRLERRIDV